jgi:hypothetical protein
MIVAAVLVPCSGLHEDVVADPSVNNQTYNILLVYSYSVSVPCFLFGYSKQHVMSIIPIYQILWEDDM